MDHLEKQARLEALTQAYICGEISLEKFNEESKPYLTNYREATLALVEPRL